MAVRAPVELLAKAKPALSGGTVLKNMCCVSGASMLGDLGCQTLESLQEENSRFEWDHLRTLRMGFTGAFVVTPMSMAWNMYAERLAPGRSWRAIVTKVGVSVAVIPPMLASQFMSLTLLEEGKTMEDVHRKLSQDLVPTCVKCMFYWPIVSGLNAAFVPVMSRPSVSSFAGVFWNIYMSHQANSGRELDLGEDVAMVYPLERIDALREAGAFSTDKLTVEKHNAGNCDGEGTLLKAEEGSDATDSAKIAEKRDSTERPRAVKSKGKFVRRMTVVPM